MEQTFHYTLQRWVSVLQGMMMTDLKGEKNPKGKKENHKTSDKCLVSELSGSVM